MKPRAKRTENIANVGAFAIWEKANALEAEGKKIVHLELGEPDFDTPAHIMEAAQEALLAGRTRYGSAVGSPALREAIASYVTRTRQIDVEASRVMVTPGVKSALFFALHALVESGDEVLLPNPGFPAYQQIVRITEGTPICYPLSAENGFLPVSADIEALITPKTKCLLLNSPANPTGTIHTKETVAEMAALAQKYDLWVISDEIYYQLHFTAEPPPSIYSLPGMAERTILCDGFSKPYAMTGWRLGFGIFPADLCESIYALMVNNHSSLPLFIQDAGLVALEGAQDCVVDMVATYKKRRDLVVRLLDTIPGIRYTYPDGAFYIMIDVSAITDDVNALADALLEAGVALLPAASFGSNGEGFLRLAFCQSEENISWALEQVKQTILRK
ncbi:MAG: pyridoxal phosphate-dependent aminotransferase [Ardenticatenaceae bacterium]